MDGCNSNELFRAAISKVRIAGMISNVRQERELEEEDREDKLDHMHTIIIQGNSNSAGYLETGK